MGYTPMMEQYLATKNEYKDYILFYRLGDFYEMFFDDAKTASKVLELTLTGKDCGVEERAPMCGIPYHAAETYIGRLIQAGYKVAICEQVEDPALAKGIVKREVVRTITPGTVIESDLLNEQKNNYLASIYVNNNHVGLCFADVSTQYICATAFDFQDVERNLLNEISIYAPREIIINRNLDNFPLVKDYIEDRGRQIYLNIDESYFDEEEVTRLTREQFNFKIIDEKSKLIALSVGGTIKYIADTQKSDKAFFKHLEIYESSQFLEVDSNTRRNLELTETMLTKEKRGSLLWVLDKTSSAMGARLLRSRLEHPLTNVALITKRQQAVAELCQDFMLREEIKTLLQNVLDLERLMTKIDYGTASARDLRAIHQTLSILPEVRQLISHTESEELREIYLRIDELQDICELIDASIVDEPPFSIREGGIIRDGYNSSIDDLRSIMNNGKGFIDKIEAEEREKTGIKALRIGFNRVFGYYIEVTKSFLSQVPDTYIRKQTLVNCERYITEELKNMESTILGAEDRCHNLEFDEFVKIRDTVGNANERIRMSANALASLDCYVSLAQVAAQNNYQCPTVDYSDVIEIKDGRHPVVEQFVRDTYFVPNDTNLNTTDSRLMLITGPNMAGKSTYMRQTALITLMAQIGSFVPASDCRIGVVDKLFTRVGASDDLASGQSTFMLEMREVAYILKNATKKSLIIYDEIGRGTSTYDGMSIAKAVAEYTAGKKLGAKTMFATHYHELTELENTNDGIVNYNVAAKKRGDDVTFLRKIVRGPADDSYGIEVAKLAGISNDIVKRAKEILQDLTSGERSIIYQVEKAKEDTLSLNLSIDDAVMDEVKEKIKATDINTLTPIEAMNLIFEWKKMLS